MEVRYQACGVGMGEESRQERLNSSAGVRSRLQFVFIILDP